jgi:DNA-binding GntR family transcriptional regulator
METPMAQQVADGRRQDSGPPQSRTAYVMERIKDDLAKGVIGPGETIKQTVLAKRYGVSPTPVREALRILQSDGLISYSPHKGASVRELKPEAARDLYRLRSGAERVATEMAVERMTPEGLVAVEAKFAELDALMKDPTSTSTEISVANKAFHFALYEQASTLVVGYLELLWSRFTPTSTVFMDRKVATKLHRQHELIMEAVRRGDAATAGEITAQHILSASAHREQMPLVRAAGDEDNAEISRA